MIDFDRFLRSVIEVKEGGSGYDGGLRHFNCPLCGDHKGRGWVGVTGFGAGCFNPGCPAEPTLPGGAVEWARRVLGFAARAEAWRHLAQHFSADAPLRSAAPPRGADFCRMPPYSRSFEPESVASSMQGEFARFVRRQWGVDVARAARAGLRWCVMGKYAYRVVIPVVMFGRLVGFQARAVRPVMPKYLTSRYGPESDPAAECGRPASAMLYNLDAVRSGAEVLLVEGAGDSLGWAATGSTTPAVATLGTALTPAKLTFLHAASPSRVVVALDEEPEAQRRALAHVEDLRTWGLNAVRGRWVGGKDAGSGASLVVESRTTMITDAVRARFNDV